MDFRQIQSISADTEHLCRKNCLVFHWLSWSQSQSDTWIARTTQLCCPGIKWYSYLFLLQYKCKSKNLINLLVFSAIFRNNVNNSGHNSNHWKKLSERMQSSQYASPAHLHLSPQPRMTPEPIPRTASALLRPAATATQMAKTSPSTKRSRTSEPSLPHPFTGWPFRLIPSFCWHQNQSSISTGWQKWSGTWVGLTDFGNSIVCHCQVLQLGG